MISFPGLLYARSLRYTCTRGVIPDMAIIECLPQASPVDADGDLSISDAGLTITLNNCRVDWGSIRRDSNGSIVHLRIWDRRWWWRYRKVTGAFNFRQADGTRDPVGEKSLRQLAAILLNQMGEAGYDVSALPTNVFPDVEWDRDNPAQELEKLCEDWGFCVCWNPVTDVVTIRPTTDTTTLPANADVKSVSYAVNSGERPSAINMGGGPTSYQSKLAMEPVGQDTDGSIVHIDDLSYKPAAGWTWMQGTQFDDVADEFGEEERRLALKSVFRWYRVVSQADGSQDVPGYGEVADIGFILPIDEYLNDTFTDADGYERRQRAFVQGVFLTKGDNDTQNTEADALVENSFRLVESIGMVIFDAQMVKLDGDEIAAAELYLTCTYNVTDEATHTKVRYEKVAALSGAPAYSGELPITREELVEQFSARYAGTDPNEVTSVDFNSLDVDTEADALIAQAAQGLGDTEAHVVSYRFLQDIRLDGAVWQVTWLARMRDQSNEGGTDTVAGRRMEFDHGTNRLRDRRRFIRGLYRMKFHSSPRRRQFDRERKRS